MNKEDRQMSLTDLIQRGIPQPWTEGDNIPWNDRGFSQRMLREHLSQEHDAATRKLVTVDRHVSFIQRCVLDGNGGQAHRVLDLGCGPGLYTHRLARLGYTVHGIDFSPASIDYARHVAQADQLNCTYTLGDIRTASYPDDNDLVMLIFGEFNVFRPVDVRLILKKALAALRLGGRLLLEPHTEEAVRKMGGEASSWYTSISGLFSDRPHLMLSEAFWNDASKTGTTRYFLVDAETKQVTRYAASYQAYSNPEYQAVLEECGFTRVKFFPSLTGADEPGDFFALVAEK
jgi:SAM-dependent methyltransferase